jgi:chromosome segregation ATPase
LNHLISDIKLNEAQAAQVKEIEEKLREIGKPVEPSRTENAERTAVIETEINSLTAQIQAFEAQLQQKIEERNAYTKENQAGLSERDASRRGVNDISNRIDSLIEEQKTIKLKIRESQEKLRRSQQELGFKSRDEAQTKIDEINYSIETSTLNNRELSKRLADIDRLQAGFKKLDVLENLRAELDQARGRDTELSGLLSEARLERETLREKSRGANEASQIVRQHIDEMWQVQRRIRDQIKELKDRIFAQRGELRQIEDAHYAALNAYRLQLQQSSELNYERTKIYAEAERIMAQMEEGQRKVGEIRERKNPNEKEIAAASSLISYLEECQQKLGAKPEEKPEIGKKGQRDAAALLAGLHKTKKQKEKKGAKAAGLSHSLETMAQFAKVDVAAPMNVDQIPVCVEILKKKVKDWSDSFSRAVVNFLVDGEGQVNVSISLA